MKPSWLMIIGGFIILLAGLLGGSDGGGILPVEPEGEELPSDGNQVLIIFEGADVFGYTQDQLAIIKGDAMASFLEGKCPGNWRRWDQSDPVPNAPESLQRWMQKFEMTGATTPYLIVSDGEHGTSGPLPATPEEVMQVVNGVIK